MEAVAPASVANSKRYGRSDHRVVGQSLKSQPQNLLSEQHNIIAKLGASATHNAAGISILEEK